MEKGSDQRKNELIKGSVGIRKIDSQIKKEIRLELLKFHCLLNPHSTSATVRLLGRSIFPRLGPRIQKFLG